MSQNKPDLLLILVIILGVGVLLTNYGSDLFKGWDVQAMTHLSSK